MFCASRPNPKPITIPRALRGHPRGPRPSPPKGPLGPTRVAMATGLNIGGIDTRVR